MNWHLTERFFKVENINVSLNENYESILFISIRLNHMRLVDIENFWPTNMTILHVSALP